MAKADGKVSNEAVADALRELLTGESKEVHLTEIVHHGDKLILPETLTKKQAIKILQRQLAFDEEDVAVSFEFDAFIFDGAVAAWECMREQYGFPTQEPTPGFFGPQPPMIINVATGPYTTVAVPWGRIKVPSVEGYFQTSYAIKNGHFIFKLDSLVKRMYEKSVNELAKRITRYLKEKSIYRGRAIKLRLRDDDGDQFKESQMLQVTPQFLELSKVEESSLLYNDDVREAIATNLFTPIKHSDSCRAAGVPLKRGILLAGPFGVGKSLTAFVTARICEDNGWSFFYCERANELADMVTLAKQYTPSCVFCEDIDRVMSGERTMDMDALLNVIDGIETKGTDLMVVLTTNYLENINRAMLRPGRLDAIINLDVPDGKTVEALMRRYAGELLSQNEVISEAAHIMGGNIPAVIRECVERAKLSAVKLNPEGPLKLTGAALTDAAKLMHKQLGLVTPKSATDKQTPAEKVATGLEEMYLLTAGK